MKFTERSLAVEFLNVGLIINNCLGDGVCRLDNVDIYAFLLTLSKCIFVLLILADRVVQEVSDSLGARLSQRYRKPDTGAAVLLCALQE